VKKRVSLKKKQALKKRDNQMALAQQAASHIQRCNFKFTTRSKYF